MMQVVLLAAGRGTRLGSLTETRSKAMMPVLGRPVIQWALDAFIEAGLTSFVVVIRPGDQELRSFLSRLNQGNLEVRIVEQPEPLGMGHALHCAAPYLGSRFLLSACDSVFPQTSIERFTALWVQRDELVVLLGVEQAKDQDLSQRSVVMMDGPKVLQIIEKPAPHEIRSDVTSLPLYGLSRKILPEIAGLKPSSRGELELQPAIQRLIDGVGGAEGVSVHRRWNLTTGGDLLAMNLEALREAGPLFEEVPFERDSGVRIHPPVRVEAGVVLGKDIELGPEVYLEAGCELGEGVKITRAVVLRQAYIPPGSRIAGEVVG